MTVVKKLCALLPPKEPTASCNDLLLFMHLSQRILINVLLCFLKIIRANFRRDFGDVVALSANNLERRDCFCGCWY